MTIMFLGIAAAAFGCAALHFSGMSESQIAALEAAKGIA